MKRLMTAALLLTFAGGPSLARAATINAGPAVPVGAVESPGEPPIGAASSSAAPGETADYAAREAASPQLGKFQGGSVVVYIGGGTLLIVLVVILIILVI